MKIIHAMGNIFYRIFYAIFSSVGYIVRLLWKMFYEIFSAIFFLIKWVFKILYYILKAFLYLFGVPWKAKSKPIIPPIEYTEITFPKEKAVAKVGTIVPVEEDHGLRTFTILNPEGEIFKINTALPSPFYGPNWTRILSCYETKETVHARLIKPIYIQQGRIMGYQVKIGNVKAILPASEAMRPPTDKSINIRVSIIQINPNDKKVIVSARQAYYTIFAKKPLPKTGEETEALFWDYDDEFLYFLLPGEYIGQAIYQVETSKLDSWMGTITHCRIESIQAEEQRAVVSLLAPSKTIEPSQEKFPLPGVLDEFSFPTQKE